MARKVAGGTGGTRGTPDRTERTERTGTAGGVKAGGDKFQERMLDSFRVLCNADGVNKQLSTQDVDELRSMMKQIPTPLNVNSDPAPAQAPLPKFTDRFKQRLQEEQTKSESESGHGESEAEPSSPKEDGSKSEAGSDEDVDDDETGSQSSKSSRRSQTSKSSGQSHQSLQRKRRPETHEQTKMKRNYLVILRTLQKEGYQPTQEFTMDDPLEEIKEEVDQYYMCKEATSFVSKWKGNVEVGASLVEIGAQFIPKQPLKLQGLQARIRKIHETKQVDIDWERIYYTYRRKKMSNPLWSLAIAYGLAMLSTSISNHASAKLGQVLGGVGGGGDGGGGGNGGGGGLDLGGIIGSLFGAFGGAGGGGGGAMPSMSSGLPGTDPSPAPDVPSSPHQRPQPQPHQAHGPRRGFKRNVFFTR